MSIYVNNTFFADDTNVTLSLQKSYFFAIMKSELIKLSEYMNVKKTKYILFCTKK